MTDLVSILEPHGISCELVEYEKECTHDRYVIDLTALRCASRNTHVDVGIEKRRGRNGADIVLIPEVRSMFRRDLDSEALAEQIVKILCDHGATNEPHARCEDLE